MSDGFYLDNDVVLKLCSYGAGIDLVQVSTVDELPPAILALARFTLTSRVARSKILVEPAIASTQLQTVLSRARLLEPSQEEVEVAADLEAAATLANLAFDTGESQLVAMLISRNGLGFITGDKRAARAMSVILPQLEARLFCLEQILYTIVARAGVEPLRSSVCRERATDRAISNCFQCSSPDIEQGAILHGLASYSGALRSETGRLLAPNADMSGPEVAQEHGVGRS